MFLRAVFVGCTIFAVPVFVNAAALYIDPPFSQMARGDTINLSVRLDVDESIQECVNAIDGVLSYSEGLDPVDISVGGSIISLWPEKPTINRDSNTITFAGGIPNGYCGRVTGDPRLTNTLLQIVFRSPSFAIGGGTSVGTATVAFAEQSAVYLNDGRGTRVAPNLYPAQIGLNANVSSEFKNEWQDIVEADNQPPEEFSIVLEKNRAYSARYYITFNTTDKQSGIDQYQVMEEPLNQFGAFQWGRADAPWITVEGNNVYVLDDQSLNSIIRVKAIDKAGNEYIATLIPEESLRTLSRSELYLYGGIAAVLIILLMVAVTMWVYRQKSRSVRPVTRRTPDKSAAEAEDADLLEDADDLDGGDFDEDDHHDEVIEDLKPPKS